LGAIDPGDSIGVARQQARKDNTGFGGSEFADRHGETRKRPQSRMLAKIRS
jgi:hypothetical protein